MTQNKTSLSQDRIDLLVNRIDKKTKAETGVAFSELVTDHPELLSQMSPQFIDNEDHNITMSELFHKLYEFQQEHLTHIDEHGNQDAIDDQNIVSYLSRHYAYFTGHSLGFDLVDHELGSTPDITKRIETKNRLRLGLYSFNKENNLNMHLIVPTSRSANGQKNENDWSEMAFGKLYEKDGKPHVSILKATFTNTDASKKHLFISHSEVGHVSARQFEQTADGLIVIKDPSKPILTHTKTVDSDFGAALHSLSLQHKFEQKNDFEVEETPFEKTSVAHDLDELSEYAKAESVKPTTPSISDPF